MQDEIENLKTLSAACQAKNEKIKKLTAEVEALKNELNRQQGKPHFRYIIWNTKEKKQQFPSICEMTEDGAYIKLFHKIGWDAAKYRFVVKRVKVEGDDDWMN